jgi:uncharacterized protein (TIGR02679 family)
VDQQNLPSNERVNDGARRAAEWVRSEKLEHPFALARERYVARGEPAGQVRIEQPTAPERRLFGDVLGRSIRLGPLSFSLGELDQALLRSTFACSLVDLLEALEEAPIVTRPERRRARQDHEDAWRRELDEIVNRSLGRELAQGWGRERGLALLHRRFKSASVADRAAAGTAFARCLEALAQLPREPAVRLAVFATELTGDPHAFDQTHLAGQLLTIALVAADRRADFEPRLTAERRAASFERFGLLTDTVWATVAAFNLTRALTHAGSSDPLVEVAGARVLNLSLRQLARWRAVEPGSSDVYVVENPSVFETLVDGLESAGSIGHGYPTLVCTSGYLSQPSYRLLDLLVAGGPVRLWYSGDFDPEGLEIATTVLNRYPSHARAWRLGVADYEQAATNGVPAQGERLQSLDRLAAVFPDLVPVMRERLRWGYQETLIDVLLDDVRGPGRGLGIGGLNEQ